MSTELSPARLLAVMVVHERSLDQIVAWSFLRQRLAEDASRGSVDKASGFVLEHLLIYDNSPLPCAQPAAPLPGCTYVSDPRNGGTAAAYDRACAMASLAGVDWLLLLDQDTALPDGFLEAASAAMASHPRPPYALVPWVFHGPIVLSPARVTDAGTVAPLSYRAPVPAGKLTAISSGCLLHAPTLAAVLPLPKGLWLDYVDHWIFLQMHSRGLPVRVFDAALQHDLSVYAVDSLSTRRLTSILNGEASFQALLGTKARLVYPLRLAARVLRYARTRPELALHTLHWMFQRMKGHP
jgi:hypothetical protein